MGGAEAEGGGAAEGDGAGEATLEQVDHRHDQGKVLQCYADMGQEKWVLLCSFVPLIIFLYFYFLFFFAIPLLGLRVSPFTLGFPH